MELDIEIHWDLLRTPKQSVPFHVNITDAFANHYISEEQVLLHVNAV
eukprot:TsM_000391000 transcript=TsM_000391000 gene=TsM_000391000